MISCIFNKQKLIVVYIEWMYVKQQQQQQKKEKKNLSSGKLCPLFVTVGLIFWFSIHPSPSFLHSPDDLHYLWSTSLFLSILLISVPCWFHELHVYLRRGKKAEPEWTVKLEGVVGFFTRSKPWSDGIWSELSSGPIHCEHRSVRASFCTEKADLWLIQEVREPLRAAEIERIQRVGGAKKKNETLHTYPPQPHTRRKNKWLDKKNQHHNS